MCAAACDFKKSGAIDWLVWGLDVQYYGFEASVLPFCNVLETQNFTATPFETGIAAALGNEAGLDAFLTAIQEVNYAAIPGDDDPATDRAWMWQYCSEWGM